MESEFLENAIVMDLCSSKTNHERMTVEIEAEDKHR